MPVECQYITFVDTSNVCPMFHNLLDIRFQNEHVLYLNFRPRSDIKVTIKLPCMTSYMIPTVIYPYLSQFIIPFQLKWAWHLPWPLLWAKIKPEQAYCNRKPVHEFSFNDNNNNYPICHHLQDNRKWSKIANVWPYKFRLMSIRRKKNLRYYTTSVRIYAEDFYQNFCCMATYVYASEQTHTHTAKQVGHGKN